jgi:sarcosine oxidase subunit alpha
MRIFDHPILEFHRGKPVALTFNQQPIPAFEGETIAAALHAAGVRVLSESARRQRPRGFFCAIGKCSSCLMEVDGIPNVKTCLVLVRDGMTVRSQSGWGELPPKGAATVFSPKIIPTLQTDVAIVGGGPAGLSAAIEAAKLGCRVRVFDENHRAGGQLIKQTHMFFGSREHYARIRGVDISEKLLGQMSPLEIELHLNSSVIGYFPPHTLALIQDSQLKRVEAKKIIIATGASENMLAFENNDLPGVYGAGAVQTLMNVFGVLPGQRVLMIGAGNIGVIVSYQLLQAGVEVVAVIEATPKIGAYQVHASKIARMGIPILTAHTIRRAVGTDHVEAAEIIQLDENWQELAGTERVLDVDTICLAVGLNPSSEILSQAGAKMKYIPALGGNVAWHNENLETTVSGIYVAGDVSGIEEASSAMLEGRLAGIAAAESLLGTSPAIQQLKTEVLDGLQQLREGPFGEKTRQGNAQLQTEGVK